MPSANALLGSLFPAAALRRFLTLSAGVIALAGASTVWANSAPDRYSRLQAQDLRVASVAHRLSIANARFCAAALTPQPGFVVHGLEQYAASDRAAATRRFGLAQRIGVMAVVGGSASQRAGLVAGDQLVSVNGRAFPESPPADNPGRVGVDRAQALLLEEMRRGAVTLRVEGGSGIRDVRFAAEQGCPALVELIPGGSTNAWADGDRIMIGEGLLRECASDADLALVIGHEMAHNLLHHRQRLIALGGAADAMRPASAIAALHSRETEEEADWLAVKLASAAAYDLHGAEAFLGGLMRAGQMTGKTHPAPPRRLALLRIAIAAQRPGAASSGARIANTAWSGLVSGRI